MRLLSVIIVAVLGFELVAKRCNVVMQFLVIIYSCIQAAEPPLASPVPNELTLTADDVAKAAVSSDPQPLSMQQLAGLAIRATDFDAAVKKVQPSVRREGFTTTPDVTWNDVGSLAEVRSAVYTCDLELLTYSCMLRHVWGLLHLSAYAHRSLATFCRKVHALLWCGFCATIRVS